MIAFSTLPSPSTDEPRLPVKWERIVRPHKLDTSIIIEPPRRLDGAEIDHFMSIMSQQEYMTGLTRDQWMRLDQVLIARKEDRVTGFVALVRGGADNVRELGPIYVDKQLQGKGIGGSLVYYSEQWANQNFWRLVAMSHNPGFHDLIDSRNKAHANWQEITNKALPIPIFGVPLNFSGYVISSRSKNLTTALKKKHENQLKPGKDRWWIRFPVNSMEY